MEATTYKALTYYNAKNPDPNINACSHNLNNPRKMIMTYNPRPQPHYCTSEPYLIRKPIRNRLDLPQSIYSNRPFVNTSSCAYLLTFTTNNLSQSKPHGLRTHQPPANIYYPAYILTNLPNSSFQCHRDYYVLCYVWSHPNSNTSNYYPLR